MPASLETPAASVTTERDRLMVRLPATSVVFDRADTHPTVGLRFGRSGIGPDVSVQPAAVVTVIDDQARHAGDDPNRWRLTLLRALVDWEPRLAWCEPAPGRLVAAVGAFTHPLLGEVYPDTDTALGEVPRWASPFLRARTAADAARVLTDGDTTRRLTRTLAASLRHPDRGVDLGPLAFAVAAVGEVTSDQLANVVDAARHTDHRASTATVAQIRTLRSGLRHFPVDRRAALLVDAARHHSAAHLADLLTQLEWIADRAPQPLPQRVDDLTELCARLVPVLAPPAPRATAPVDPTPAAPNPPHPRPRTAHEEPTPPPPLFDTAGAPARPRARPRITHAALAAPAAPSTAPPRWPVPAALLPIAGHRIDRLSFSVPTSSDELRWWSRQLANCLDTYAAAAAHERSWLIGIRHDDHLIGCIEICPTTRHIRQAHGPRNRPLPRHIHDATTRALRQAGILTTPTNAR